MLSIITTKLTNINGLSYTAPNRAPGSALTDGGWPRQWDGEWGGGCKPGERSRKGVAGSLGDGFQRLSRGKLLLSSNLQLPCCTALPSSQSSPDRLEEGRPDAPANREHFPRASKSGRVPATTQHPPPNTHHHVSAGTPIAPRSLHPLPSLPHPPRGSEEPLPQTKQGASPPGPLTYGAAVHTGVGGPLLGGAGAGRGWVRVVWGGKWGAEQCVPTCSEPSAVLSGRSPALRSACECNLSPAV